MSVCSCSTPRQKVAVEKEEGRPFNKPYALVRTTVQIDNSAYREKLTVAHNQHSAGWGIDITNYARVFDRLPLRQRCTLIRQIENITDRYTNTGSSFPSAQVDLVCTGENGVREHARGRQDLCRFCNRSHLRHTRDHIRIIEITSRPADAQPPA